MPPALVVTRPHPPAWRLALALALRAMPVFLALWRRHLRQMRRRLDRRHLLTALRQHQLDAPSTVGPEVERLLATPMREDLTTHGVALALAAMTAVQPDITRQTGVPFPVPAEHPALRARVETYVHEQLALILATTFLAAQSVIRQGTQQGMSPEALTREVQATLGLSPGQVQAREAMRERLTAQGLPPRTIQAQLDQATEQAIQRRAMAMGQVQAVALTQMGVHEAWEDAVIAGAVAASQITRRWIPLEDERLCPKCAAIPDMNRGGVGLEEPFRTPFGPVLLPPGHVNCRCVIEYRVRQP